MDRKQFIKSLAVLSAFPSGCSRYQKSSSVYTTKYSDRVRPGDPGWPSEASWETLKQEVKGRLVKVKSPLEVCKTNPQDKACTNILRDLHNPYYISNDPALTQTSGWADAWTSVPSVYAIEAEETSDVVAGVNFAREYNLRLVVKGGAHSYQGRSCSEDSLLIWMRPMNDITLHDTFVPRGCSETVAPQQAVSTGAGAIWMDAYDAVTTKGGRYVQGGGCTTVGVAGLIQSGGFGSFSKNYGLAAAGLLEAEVVTADGEVRIANVCTNPDLFWALKGGGGGSFGVVTRVTLRTRELPNFFGGVFGNIKANSDTAFRRLTTQILDFYHNRLFNRHWGEQIRFKPDNSIEIQMVFQGLNQQEAQETWQPFSDWVAGEQDFTWELPLQVAALPARHFWDAAFLKQNVPQFIVEDERTDAKPGNFFWAGDQDQTGQYLHGYHSAWLPAGLLKNDGLDKLADALVAGCRHWEISLHFNKGLAGAPSTEREAAGNTAMNPAVLEAFALAIIAGSESQVFPGLPGREPDATIARQSAVSIKKATDELLTIVPQPGSYVSESSYFEENWQQSFWGSNYPRLEAVKKKYDPDGLFFIHHGVGSDEWTDNGFKKITEPR